jgi:hypothetical protein
MGTTLVAGFSTGLVIGDRRFKIPGINIRNWYDDPRLKLKLTGPEADGYVRGSGRWTVRNTCFHTTSGSGPIVINPGVGPDSKMDELIARSWTNSKRQAGAHLVIDFDGSVFCCADLLTTATYHAGAVNGHSVGIEICQNSKFETWESQYNTLVAISDFLSLAFSFQRFYQYPYDINEIARIHAGAGDVVGFYTHYHQTTNRGRWDSGKHSMEVLGQAGYKPVNYNTGEDRIFGKDYQKNVLGLTEDDVDGVLGPSCVALMKQKGVKYGQLISRPNDDTYARILGLTDV